MGCGSFIPESPRFLISHDRHEEAYAILVKYHSEGEETDFSRAEMAQIRTTVALELESSKQSWWSMVDTPGMRRRILVCAFMGLFAQFSGNTLISFVHNSSLSIDMRLTTRSDSTWESFSSSSASRTLDSRTSLTLD